MYIATRSAQPICLMHSPKAAYVAVAFCGAPYVDAFAAAHEVMRVDMPYEGPETGAAIRSVENMFEDM